MASLAWLAAWGWSSVALLATVKNMAWNSLGLMRPILNEIAVSRNSANLPACVCA